MKREFYSKKLNLQVTDFKATLEIADLNSKFSEKYGEADDWQMVTCDKLEKPQLINDVLRKVAR